MKEMQVVPNVKCYHCGDDCSSDTIKVDNKVFCCAGCKTVYELLDENLLCNYYAFENSPGNKNVTKDPKEYSFLDEESIKDSLLSFKEDSISGITFYIPSIHCSSCIWLLENLQKIHPGIIHSTIHFQKKEVHIHFSEERISLAQLASLLDSLGYPPEITLNSKTVTNKSIDKSLLYKIGIAGFCFGNIMLLSMPEYVSFWGDFRGELKAYFGALSLVLALPVFCYSASDYFKAAWNAVTNKVINIDLPIALALLAAFSQSFYEIVTQSGTGYLDSLTGLVFFLLIGKWYQRKTYAALTFERDYKSYFPMAALVYREGKESFVPLNELVPGDVILIKNGDIIPADGVLTEGNAQIDYSFVTGESLPVTKKLKERLFAGGKQTGASIKIEVLKKVSESYLTQLWNKEGYRKKSVAGLELFTNKVGKYFTVAILLTGLLTYIYWYFNDQIIALHAMISVLIIFCPCTLSLAIPFCFGNAMNIMSRNGLYLKNTESIERMADSNAIVFDKTGTITSNGDSELEFIGNISEEDITYIKSLTEHSSHPLSRILSVHFKEAKAMSVENYKEILSGGLSGQVGQNEIMLGSSEFVGTGDNLFVPLHSTRVFVKINNEVKGYFLFKNKYRKGIKELLGDLGKKFSLHLLSGDNDAEKKRLKNYFKEAHMRFYQKPFDKLSYIKELEKTHKTIMLGDGLNDAGALLESNCGISVSESSVGFYPACDGILESSKLNKLSQFISFTKSCVQLIKYSLLISLSYNLVGLYFACQGLLQPLVAAILMPLSSLSIVLFVIVVSNALARRFQME